MARQLVSSSNRQKSSRTADTWRAEQRPDGLWAVRDLGHGWLAEHRVERQGRQVVISETRVRPSGEGSVPPGGIDSELLRRVRVRGVEEAVADLLPLPASLEDLQGIEGLSPARRRRGEARRWDLAVTAYAYVQAIEAGSERPNEDVADALGLSVKAVTDRLYHARRHEPPLLTESGGRGDPGEARLTDAGWEALGYRLGRLVASLGPPPGTSPSLFIGGEGPVLGANLVFLLRDAERRIPGIWEMDIDEVRRKGAETKPVWADELLASGEVELEYVRDRRSDKPRRKTSR